VVSLRRKGEVEESDERILGGGDFVQAVLKEVEERQLRQFKVRRRGLSATDIIEEECAKRGVRPKELMNGSRRSVVSRLRALVAHRCAEEVGVSAAEIARHLGVTTPSITRAIARMEEHREK
jgi:CRP-like cAMP-binding protein